MAKTNQTASRTAPGPQEALAIDTQAADQNIDLATPEADAEMATPSETPPEPIVQPLAAPDEPPAKTGKPAAVAEPPTPEPKAPSRKRIRNVSCKGLTIYCVSGAPMVFDAEGVAEVSLPDYLHLKKIPGYDDVE
jgi:hypothetical protein